MTVSNLVRVCWSFTPDTLRVMSHHTGIKFISGMVPGAGLEPALPFGNQILSLERLPFRHPGQGQISSGEIGRTVSSWRASLARPAISGHGLLFWNESRLTWAGRPCHVARASRPWDRATAPHNKRPLRAEHLFRPAAILARANMAQVSSLLHRLPGDASLRRQRDRLCCPHAAHSARRQF